MPHGVNEIIVTLGGDGIAHRSTIGFGMSGREGLHSARPRNTWRGMATITREQAAAVRDRLQPTIGYVVRLRERMGKVGFVPGDRLYDRVRAAQDALRDLLMELHYLSCEAGRAPHQRGVTPACPRWRAPPDPGSLSAAFGSPGGTPAPPAVACCLAPDRTGRSPQSSSP